MKKCLVSRKHIKSIRKKVDKLLCETMGFKKPEIKSTEYECYLVYHTPKEQKQACVTVDLLNNEIEVYCENDVPRREYLKGVCC
jgi:hypothetical protein